MKKLEEQAKLKGESVKKKKSEKTLREPKQVMMSNGQLAVLPFIQTEPTGPIGRKAQLEIEKIIMSREEKAEAKQLEEMSKKEREDRKFKKARKDFEK